MQRRVFHHRDIGDNHAGRVGTHVADDPFHVAGGVDQVPHVVALFVDGLEVHIFERFRQGGLFAQRGRDGLGDAIHFREGNIHHTANIADGAFCAHGAEGDDLGYFIGTVFLSAVFHDTGAFIILEIEVDIRHGDTARVEEPFKE